jgi:hypothetical protein
MIPETDEDAPRFPEAELQVSVFWTPENDTERLPSEIPITITEETLAYDSGGELVTPRVVIRFVRTLEQCLDSRVSGTEDGEPDCSSSVMPESWGNPAWVCTNDDSGLLDLRGNIDLPTETPMTVELTELINPEELNVRARGSVRAQCSGVDLTRLGGEKTPGVVNIRLDF